MTKLSCCLLATNNDIDNDNKPFADVDTLERERKRVREKRGHGQ